MRYVELAEAANLLGLNLVALWRYINAGQIKAQRIGETYQILDSELEAFAKKLRDSKTPGNVGVSPVHWPPGVGVKRLNSGLIEAIAEMARDYTDMRQLRELIAECTPEFLPFLEALEGEGVTDPHEAILRLAIVEAQENLRIFNALLKTVRSGNAIVLLPLRPDLKDALLVVMKGSSYEISSRIFDSDRVRHPQPKGLARIRNLDEITLAELSKLVHGVEAVVIEAQMEGQQLFVRDLTLNLFFLLSKNLKDLYVRRIDIPRAVRLQPLDLQGVDPNIMLI